MRLMARKAGLTHPEYITARNLRTHVCTMARALDLSEENVSILADLLGHSKEVQNKIYRLPLDTLLLAKAAKVLFAVQEGVSSFKGQRFDEIDLDLHELLPDTPPDEDEGLGSELESDDDKNFSEDDENEVEEARSSKESTSPNIQAQSSKTTENEAESSKKSTSLPIEARSSKTTTNPTSDAESSNTTRKTSPTKLKRKGKRFTLTPTKKEDKITWTKSEKAEIEKHFSLLFREKTSRPPTKGDILNFLEKHPHMKNRPWRIVKSTIYYMLKKT